MACAAPPPSLVQILSYDGGVLDMAINYSVLTLTLLALGNAQRSRPASAAVATLSLLFVSSFQIGLCLCLGCTGVSIVWNAAAGYALPTELTRRTAADRAILATLALCLIVDVYYAVTAEQLTTIAHGCAILLGAVLGGLFRCAVFATRSRAGARRWYHLQEHVSGASDSRPCIAEPLNGSEAMSAASARTHARTGLANHWLLQRLSEPMARTAPVQLEPLCFFIAWHGVLVLTWRGFPASLLELKGEIERQSAVHSHAGAAIDSSDLLTLRLKAEGAGSKWPKTTLASLNESSPNFTLEELRRLKHICIEHTAALHPHGRIAPKLNIDVLSAVAYRWRSLEIVDEIQQLPMGSALLRESPKAETANVPIEEAARVRAVMQEWVDEEAYLTRVNEPGSRVKSYREHSPSGCTLVAILFPHTAPPPLCTENTSRRTAVGMADSLDLAKLSKILGEFRAAVDAEFPGRYTWFERTSLHCTIRSLNTEAH